MDIALLLSAAQSTDADEHSMKSLDTSVASHATNVYSPHTNYPNATARPTTHPTHTSQPLTYDTAARYALSSEQSRLPPISKLTSSPLLNSSSPVTSFPTSSSNPNRASSPDGSHQEKTPAHTPTTTVETPSSPSPLSLVATAAASLAAFSTARIDSFAVSGPESGRIEKRPGKPFCCTYEGCDATFGQKGSLTRHIRSRHEKLRPHTCTLCQKSFSALWTLRVHQRNVHLKSKPHKCHLCDKSFGELFNKSKHIAIVHEGKRPFSCPICSRAFGYKGDMRKHVLELHEQSGRPFQCIIPSCGVKFARKRYLRRHENLSHRGHPLLANRDASFPMETSSPYSQGDSRENDDGNTSNDDVDDDVNHAPVPSDSDRSSRIGSRMSFHGESGQSRMILSSLQWILSQIVRNCRQGSSRRSRSNFLKRKKHMPILHHFPMIWELHILTFFTKW